MASTKSLILAAVLVVGANAKFPWNNDQEDNFFRNPFRMQMPFPPTPPRLPNVPFPNFQHFAPFPPNFNNFHFPNIPMPQVLTPDQIKNTMPGPNQMFTGSVVKSESRVVIGPDGKPIRQGGTSILTNVDGKVKEVHEGNAPPDLSQPIKVGQPW